MAFSAVFEQILLPKLAKIARNSQESHDKLFLESCLAYELGNQTSQTYFPQVFLVKAVSKANFPGSFLAGIIKNMWKSQEYAAYECCL